MRRRNGSVEEELFIMAIVLLIAVAGVHFSYRDYIRNLRARIAKQEAIIEKHRGILKEKEPKIL